GWSVRYRRRMRHDGMIIAEREPGAEPSGRVEPADVRWKATMRTSLFRLIASSLAFLPLAASCSPPTSGPPTPAQVAERLNRLAVPFVEKAGQAICAWPTTRGRVGCNETRGHGT